jgi:hypothetical protein
MFKSLFKKLGLGAKESMIADAVLSEVADKATGGAASQVDEAVQAIGAEVKRRKRK